MGDGRQRSLSALELPTGVVIQTRDAVDSASVYDMGRPGRDKRLKSGQVEEGAKCIGWWAL